MRNKKAEAIILIICGLICIGAGLFVFFKAYTIFPNSDSNRVQDFNWLLKTLGKKGTAILFSIIGIIPLLIGFKKLLR